MCCGTAWPNAFAPMPCFAWWLAVWLAGWLVGWVCWLVCWLGLLAGFVDWFVGCVVGWVCWPCLDGGQGSVLAMGFPACEQGAVPNWSQGKGGQGGPNSLANGGPKYANVGCATQGVGPNVLTGGGCAIHYLNLAYVYVCTADTIRLSQSTLEPIYV